MLVNQSAVGEKQIGVWEKADEEPKNTETNDRVFFYAPKCRDDKTDNQRSAEHYIRKKQTMWDVEATLHMQIIGPKQQLEINHRGPEKSQQTHAKILGENICLAVDIEGVAEVKRSGTEQEI